jgi:hypothetical protein
MKFVEIYDYVLDTTESTGSTNTQKSTTKINEIPIDLVIDVGKRFKIAINCGGTAKNIYGAYKYEAVS